jgi:hypothetical protein
MKKEIETYLVIMAFIYPLTKKQAHSMWPVLSGPAETKRRNGCYGVFNNPMQTDRPIRFENDRSRGKPSPVDRRIFTALSATTQTRIKFRRGLRRNGLTDASARVLLSPTQARPPVAPSQTSQIASPSRT